MRHRNALAWQALNVALMLLAAAIGYASMSPEFLAQAEMDGVSCLAILFGSFIIAIGGPLYALKAHRMPVIRRPSWHRSPFVFWRDPLQFLAIATLTTLAATIGCLPRLPQTGLVGFWTAMSNLSMSAGLIIGQVMIYGIFRRRIVPG